MYMGSVERDFAVGITGFWALFSLGFGWAG